MKKSLTISELITNLEAVKKEIGDQEVFFNDGEKPLFYGVTNVAVMASASDDKQYAFVLAK